MKTTQPLEMTPERRKKLQAGLAAVEDLAARYERDPALRARIDSGDIGASLADLGVALPAGVEAKIVANNADTFHVVFPPDPNTELSEEMLTVIGGGNTVGTVQNTGTASSLNYCFMWGSAGSG